MDNTKLTSDITGLQSTKTTADTANISKQDTGMKSDTEISKEKENKSAIMESVDNLVTTAGEIGKSAIAGGSIIMIVGLIAAAVALVFFMKSPEAMAMAKDSLKKKGGGINNPYSVLIILGLILLFTYKPKK
jgi:phosphotransferase system  glucose/maltose/N-acetylglucosamine-specific IIC component